jgi:hypothetical protein
MKPPRPPPPSRPATEPGEGSSAPEPAADGLDTLLRGLESNSERIQDVLGRLQELQRLLWTTDEGTIAVPSSPETRRGASLELGEPERPPADPQGGTIPRRRRKEENP